MKIKCVNLPQWFGEGDELVAWIDEDGDLVLTQKFWSLDDLPALEAIIKKYKEHCKEKA